MLDVDFVQTALGGDDVLGVTLDVRSRAAEAARGLVHHDPRVRQGDALAGFTRRQDQRTGRGGHAHDHGRDRRLDVLHGVVDRERRGHLTAGAVDVHADFLLRVFRFQEQQLGADQRGHAVLERTGQEDDPLAQQARKDVERPFAAAGLLHHHRHQVVGDVVDRIAHEGLLECLRAATHRAHACPLRYRVAEGTAQGVTLDSARP
ncbi:hypothetical protein D3C81_1454570 [compost metagenome]